jgi:hypothetical protein
LARPTKWRRKALKEFGGGPKRLTFRDKKKTEKKKKDQTPENAQCPLWAQNVSSFPKLRRAMPKISNGKPIGERKKCLKLAIQLSNRPNFVLPPKFLIVNQARQMLYPLYPH